MKPGSVELQPAPLNGIVEVIVECRCGNLATALDGRPRSSTGGQLDMAAWKGIVGDIVAHRSDIPVRLLFFGAANQIAGYRLYYMLRYAKKAGVRRVTLHTDGVFWIDEATDWLIDSDVDRIILSVDCNSRSTPLTGRVHDLEARVRAAGRGPAVQVVESRLEGPSLLRFASNVRGIDWRGATVVNPADVS